MHIECCPASRYTAFRSCHFARVFDHQLNSNRKRHVLMAMAEKSAGQLIGLQIEQDNRVLRTANAEFSAKQKRFLANIRQSMCIENRDEWSDDSCIYIDDDDDTKDADFELSTSSRNKSKENRKATDKVRNKCILMSCLVTHSVSLFIYFVVFLVRRKRAICSAGAVTKLEPQECCVRHVRACITTSVQKCNRRIPTKNFDATNASNWTMLSM